MRQARVKPWTKALHVQIEAFTIAPPPEPLGAVVADCVKIVRVAKGGRLARCGNKTFQAGEGLHFVVPPGDVLGGATYDTTETILEVLKLPIATMGNLKSLPEQELHSTFNYLFSAAKYGGSSLAMEEVLMSLRKTTEKSDQPIQSRLQQTVDLLNDEWLREWSLAELAALAGLSESHFCRSFKAQFGQAPHAYLNSIRVERSRLALNMGVGPGRAAVEAGFYDQSHLSRHFSRVYGVTPGAYFRLYHNQKSKNVQDFFRLSESK